MAVRSSLYSKACVDLIIRNYIKSRVVYVLYFKVFYENVYESSYGQFCGSSSFLCGSGSGFPLRCLLTCYGTWRVVSGPPRRRVEDTSGLRSGLPSSPSGLVRLSRRAFHIDQCKLRSSCWFFFYFSLMFIIFLHCLLPLPGHLSCCSSKVFSICYVLMRIRIRHVSLMGIWFQFFYAGPHQSDKNLQTATHDLQTLLGYRVNLHESVMTLQNAPE